MNHSPEPNTKEVRRMHTIAKEDIALGEEITCNYAELGVNEVS
jgi:SET domain-containing protein